MLIHDDMELQATLFPDNDVRRGWDDFLTRELGAAHERVTSGRVAPVLDLDDFRQQLAVFDFDCARPIDAVLPWMIAQMETGIVQVAHPRYLGLFNPAPTYPSQCADRITATFNPQLASATTSPVPCEIERHTIRAVARRIGLGPEAGGHFTSGGSEANYTALICALTWANPKFAKEGARAFPGRPVFYVSRECHLAWLKIAHQAGIGRDAVRFVRTDGGGRMDCDEMVVMMEHDRLQGFVPFMIVATAGTTGGGMIDPLADCAEIARNEGLWLHVDAAWGGALVASERLRHCLDGIELADSTTVDAHKWFATSMGCGMFICADQAVLSPAFGLTTSFMPPSARPDCDPYVTTVQWSRRFLGLRFFMSLAIAGWPGYAHLVEKSVALASMLEIVLVARGWRVVNNSALAVLCLEPPAGFIDVRGIVGRVVASGRAWVSATTFEGRDVLRACVTHGETTADDILEVAKALQDAL
jgi:glutamate/tyrosine decarboxylase-like PLP-dependent enzyme